VSKKLTVLVATSRTDFGELRLGELRQREVRAEARAGKAANWSDLGNCKGGYSSTNSSTGTPYPLAIFVTVGMCGGRLPDSR
jgi:hypothetical protein